MFVTEMSPAWEYDNKRDCPLYVTEMPPAWEYDNKRECPVFVTEMSPAWEYDNNKGLSCVCYRDASCMRIW